MERPLVSVLMPMRNAEAFVRQALLSVLRQDYLELDVVVIDDGSNDRSRQIVVGLGDPRVRVLEGPEQGISAAFNCGLAAATGAVIMRCDADDRFTPGRVGRQVSFLQAHPEYGAVCGAYRSIDRKGQLAAELCGDCSQGDITGPMLEGQTLTHLCTFAIRTDVLRRTGGCRMAFVTAEDIDLQLRLAEMTRIYFQPDVSYEYRLHAASITHSQADARRRFYEALARRCRQERSTGQADSVARGDIPTPPDDLGPAKSSTDHLRGHLLAQAWRCHAAGERVRAMGFGLRALIAEPWTLQTWKSVAALGLKRPGA